MNTSSNRNSQGSSTCQDIGSRNGQAQFPCAACSLNCRSIHGPDFPECLLNGCHVCAGLEKLDDEISSIYQRLSDLIKDRQKIMAKPRSIHNTRIHRLPDEILSLIFVFVNNATFDYKFEEHDNHLSLEPPYKQPSPSPPLLVGAVCKLWREVTFSTPQLWTNITVDLYKCPVGQLNMVKKWGDRSGALPLDITIFLRLVPSRTRDRALNESGDVISAVRSLAIRWNDIALRVPGSLCQQLLDGLEVAPPIDSFFLSLQGILGVTELQHPLRPRRFAAERFPGRKIPFEWDRLVSVEITEVDDDDILHIICHAPNLKYCTGGVDNSSGHLRTPNIPITNRSLIYLKTCSDIIRHLTLPSLLHLDYTAIEDVHRSIDYTIDFLERSSAHLNEFTFRCTLSVWDPFPPFERLSAITSLIMEVEGTSHIPDPPGLDHFLLSLFLPSPDRKLPHLKEILFEMFRLSTSSWLDLCRFFPDTSPPNSVDIPLVSNTSTPNGSLTHDDIEWISNTAAFLHLSEVKKSGIDVRITDYDGNNLLIV